jgi:hypothetical protein
MHLKDNSVLYYLSLFFPFIVVLGGGALWHLQRFLQYVKYIIHEFTSSTVSFISHSPDSWNSYNRYHYFIYMHMYTFLHCIHPNYSAAINMGVQVSLL